jgi:hypothetical protein
MENVLLGLGDWGKALLAIYVIGSAVFAIGCVVGRERQRDSLRHQVVITCAVAICWPAIVLAMMFLDPVLVDDEAGDDF